MDPGSFRVYKGEEEVHLARTEFALLEFLIRHKAKYFRQRLCWTEFGSRSRSVLRKVCEHCIKKLRRKIDAPGADSFIENVHGVGYRMCDD